MGLLCLYYCDPRSSRQRTVYTGPNVDPFSPDDGSKSCTKVPSRDGDLIRLTGNQTHSRSPLFGIFHHSFHSFQPPQAMARTQLANVWRRNCGCCWSAGRERYRICTSLTRPNACQPINPSSGSDMFHLIYDMSTITETFICTETPTRQEIFLPSLGRTEINAPMYRHAMAVLKGLPAAAAGASSRSLSSPLSLASR